jgi:hypothetical protein
MYSRCRRSLPISLGTGEWRLGICSLQSVLLHTLLLHHLRVTPVRVRFIVSGDLLVLFRGVRYEIHRVFFVLVAWLLEVEAGTFCC